MNKPKARPTNNMNSQAKAEQEEHRNDKSDDHGREMPKRTRIPVTDARNLDNIEGLIPEGYVGRWVTTKEIGMYKQGGYEHVEDNLKRASGEDFLHLMMIPEEFHKEDRDIATKKAVAALGKEVIIDESKGEYTDNPTGKAVAGRVSNDPFD